MLKTQDTKHLAIASLFLALTLVLGFTQVGFLPLPTPAGAATIMHIPVILSGILFGTGFGALTGFAFGIITLIFFSHIAPFWVLIPARPLIGIVASLAYRSIYKYLSSNKKVKFIFSLLISIFIFCFVFLSGTYILTEWFSEKFITYPIEYSFLVSLIAFLISLPLFIVLREKEAEIAAMSIASFLGSLTNTIGTLGLAALFGIYPVEVSISTGIIQGVPEAILAVIICPPVALAIKNFLKKEERA
ncbi:MAG TPA: ECF transporter S component [Dictyoglomaceae bacterium]|nr:ECF transporter S component [Dictyoglomaceae bacterium]HPU44112.1 ECF transporter S component [Dictyoglomaceae bacterium]